MLYCPDCRYIYREGVEICPDCGAELVEGEGNDEDEDGMVDIPDDQPALTLSRVLLGHPAIDDEGDLVPVYSASDEVMADLVQGVLRSEGIATVVHSAGSSILEGVLDPDARDWGQVLVPERSAEEARRVVAAYLGGRKTAGERGEEESEEA